MWAFPNCHQLLWQAIKEAIVEDWRSSWFQNSKSSLGQEHWWKENRILAVFMSGSDSFNTHQSQVGSVLWSMPLPLSVTFCESPDGSQSRLLSRKQSQGTETSMKNRHCISNEISWGNKFLTFARPSVTLPTLDCHIPHIKERWTMWSAWGMMAVLWSQFQKYLLEKIHCAYIK